jgi:hypothetical protein
MVYDLKGLTAVSTAGPGVYVLLHVYHYNESFHRISFSLTGVNS